MNIDQTLRIMESASKLLGVLVWPAVIVFMLVRFGRPIGNFIASLGEVSMKAAGVEASAKRVQFEAAAALTVANVAHPEPDATPEAAARGARAVFDVVSDVATPQMIRRAARSSVLWVDDRPKNNVHERQALEAVGVRFELATSTEDALEKLRRRSFDVIISDMGRPLDENAGFTLLDKLRASGDQTPFIIYAGWRPPEFQTEAKRRGATGTTNRPDELFEMVLKALGRRNER